MPDATAPRENRPLDRQQVRTHAANAVQALLALGDAGLIPTRIGQLLDRNAQGDPFGQLVGLADQEPPNAPTRQEVLDLLQVVNSLAVGPKLDTPDGYGRATLADVLHVRLPHVTRWLRAHSEALDAREDLVAELEAAVDLFRSDIAAVRRVFGTAPMLTDDEAEAILTAVGEAGSLTTHAIREGRLGPTWEDLGMVTPPRPGEVWVPRTNDRRMVAVEAVGPRGVTVTDSEQNRSTMGAEVFVGTYVEAVGSRCSASQGTPAWCNLPAGHKGNHRWPPHQFGPPAERLAQAAQDLEEWSKTAPAWPSVERCEEVGDPTDGSMHTVGTRCVLNAGHVGPCRSALSQVAQAPLDLEKVAQEAHAQATGKVRSEAHDAPHDGHPVQ